MTIIEEENYLRQRTVLTQVQAGYAEICNKIQIFCNYQRGGVLDQGCSETGHMHGKGSIL